MTLSISYASMNRMLEEQAAKDDSLRRTLERNGRPLLSHGRGMADDALLGKLRSLGFDADRQHLSDLFPHYISAQTTANAMIVGASCPVPDCEADWVWIAVTCLWERWRPELANTEMVDDKMQAGYAALKADDTVRACGLWLEAWQAILDIMARGGIDSLDAFDDSFGGTQSVFNWVQDLEMQLHNAGLEDARFFRERIALCETMIARFAQDSVPLDNFRIALAESHFELGDRETGNQLFRRWLDERPQWGGGWIAWSDCYWLFAAPSGEKNAAKAEQMLKEGLAVPGVEGRAHLLERLADLYAETGSGEEAEAVRKEIKHLAGPKGTTAASRGSTSAQIKQNVDFGEDRLPLEQLPKPAKSLRPADLTSVDPLAKQSKIGRNDPCPCGSGKKFKTCCLKKQGDGPRLN